MINWIYICLTLSWISVFTSQSLVDLSDVLLTLTGFFVAYKNQDIKKFFLNFEPYWLWPVWLSIVVLGLAVNVGFSNIKPWNDFLEFRWILSFLSIVYLSSIIENPHKLVKYLSPVVLILNIGALYFLLEQPHLRAGGILKQIMSFSHNIALIFCVYFFLLFQGKPKEFSKTKILNLIIFLSSGFLLLSTMTRGVWIGSAVGILVASFVWNWKVFLKVSILLVFVVTTILITNQNIYDRLFSKTSTEATSNNERIALWKGNWRIIQDHPVLGVGFGQNKNHLRKYYDELGYPPEQRVSHAHNQYLQVWGGTGTLGLICFLIFIWFIFRPVHKSISKLNGFEKYWQLGLYAALVCFMTGALTEANFNIAKNRFFFLILAGLALAQAMRALVYQDKQKP